MKYLFMLISIAAVSFAKAQVKVKIGAPVALYESEEQLNTLYKQYGTMIIVEKHIYKMPCACYCRNMGGDSENRNLGGNTERRNRSGKTEGRGLGGNAESRKFGGSTEGRRRGGNTEKRGPGGDTERRNLGGDVEDRKLGGSTEGRRRGGNTEKRAQGGDMKGRNLGGNSENRNMGGQTGSFSCFKNKSGDFFFSGINPNTKILLFDGLYVEEIPSDKIKP